MNRHEIQGTVISGPHAAQTATGQQTAFVTIETIERFEEQGAPVQEREEHDVIFFAKAAQAALKNLRKGDRVFVQGRQKRRAIGQDASGAIVKQLLHARLFWKIEPHNTKTTGENTK